MKKKLIISLFILLSVLCLWSCSKRDGQSNDGLTKFTVTFETNEGTEVAPVTTAYIEKKPTTTKDKHTLEGWYDNIDLKGEPVVFPYTVVGNVTLYARWFITESGNDELKYNYDSDENTYSVKSYSGFSDIVIIPAMKGAARVTGIENDAFGNCNTVVSISIPSTVEVIGRAFYRCPMLEEFKVHSSSVSFRSINGVLFDYYSNKLFSYPRNKSGEEYEIPSGTTTIMDSAFRYCERLKKISIPVSVEVIESFFNGCTALERIDVASDNTAFASVQGVLFNKDKDTLYRLPQSYADSYEMPEDTVSIFTGALNDLRIKKLTLNAKLHYLGTIENCLLEEISVSEDNSYFSSIEGVLFNKQTTELLKYPELKKGVENKPEGEETEYRYSIPTGTERVAANAFDSAEYITVVVVPYSVKVIEAFAFGNGTALQKVIFEKGSSLERLGENALINCKKLTEISMTAPLPPELGEDAISSNVKILVPTDSLELYKTDWSKYSTQLAVGVTSEKYTVSFEVNGGVAMPAVNVPYLDEEPIPVRSGYVFAGWFNDALFREERLTIPFIPEKNVTLYAKWYKEEDGTDGLKYTLIDGDYTVSGYTGESREVFVPSTYNGKIVDAVGERAFSVNTVESISLPETITKIAPYAFSGAANIDTPLNEVVFRGNSVESIGEYAFYYCRKLKEITLPEGLRTIGGNAFLNCSMLESITLPSECTLLGARVFSHCDSLREILVENGNESFSSSNGVLYNKDKTILLQYPQNKSNLSYTIESTTEKIEEEGFYSANYLFEVIFPDNLTEFGSRAFHYCSELENITLPKNMSKLNSSVFNYSGLKSITLSSGITEIDELFSNLDSLENIFVAEGNSAFYSDNGVLYTFDKKTLIRCPIGRGGIYRVLSGTEVIGDAAVKACLLNGVVFPYGLRAIGKESFMNCYAISAVSLPETVTAIGEKAFYCCGSLNAVILPSTSLPTGGVDMFAQVGDSFSLYVASSLYSNYLNTPSWIPYSIKREQSLKTIDGVSYELTMGLDGDTSCYTVTKIITDKTSVVIPMEIENVSIIALGGYALCSGIRSLTLPRTVKRIEAYAFSSYASQLYTVIFEEGSRLETISDNAFFGCDMLKNLVLRQAEASEIPIVSYTALRDIEKDLIIYVNTPERYSESVFNRFRMLASSLIFDSFVFDGGKVIRYLGADSEVLFPTEINGGTVLSIGEKSIAPFVTSVTVSDGITALDGYCFANSSIESLTINGTSLLTIGEFAFYGCLKLESVTLPSSLTQISHNSFFEGNIRNIRVAEGSLSYKSIDGVLFNYSGNKLVIYPYARKNPDYTIPNGVTEIGEEAFNSASYLINLTLNAELKRMGGKAFADCSKLSLVALPEGFEELDDFVFYGCSSLSVITLPSGLSSVGMGCFLGCKSLSRIEVEEGSLYLTSVDGILFDKATERLIAFPENRSGSYTIPESVKEIKAYAFYNANISRVTIASEVEAIGEYAFACDEGFDSVLNVVTMAAYSQLKTLGEGAFSNQSLLERYTIPTMIETIPAKCFKNCTSLAAVTFNSQLKSIGEEAFYACPSLRDITLYDGLTEIGDYSFFDCQNLADVVLPASLTSVGLRIFGNCNAVRRLTANGLIKLSVYFGITMPSPITSLTLAEGSEEIIDSCFENAFYLKSVTIPESVETIGNDAFRGDNKLEWVTIAEGSLLSVVGERAFYNCSKLTEIEFPVSAEIFGSALEGCSNIASITFGGNVMLSYIFGGTLTASSKLETVYISDGALEIVDSAFENLTCLKLVSLPSSVTVIGDAALKGCTSLSGVVFRSAAALETIGTEAFYGCLELTGFSFSTDSPPSLGERVFYKNSSGTDVLLAVELFVPEGSLSTYKNNYIEYTTLFKEYIPVP